MKHLLGQAKRGAAGAGTVTIFVALLGVLPRASAATSTPGAVGLCRQLLTKTIDVVDDHLAVPNEEPWSLRPETEAQIQTVFADDQPDDTAKIRRVIELMMLDRAQAKGSAIRQRLLKNAMDRAFGRNDWYSKTLGRLFAVFEGSHYSYLTNRTSIESALDAKDPGTVFTYVSLLTQAFDRNYYFVRSFVALSLKGWNSGDLVFRVPLAPLLQNRVARSSIGSQWEFARRLPVEIRAQMAAAVAEHREADALADEDRDLFAGLVTSGLWDRFVHVVNIMQARGDVGAGEVEPVSFFDDPGVVDKLRHPLQRRRLDVMRQAIVRTSAKLLKQAARRERFTGYLTMTEEDLNLARLMKDPRANRAALQALIDRRPSNPRTPAQEQLIARLQRDYRIRNLTNAQRISELVVETSLKYADLPKDEFIKTVELIYETDVKHLMREDLFNPFTKMKIAMAIEAAYELTSGGHYFLARDIGIFTALLSSFLS